MTQGLRVWDASGVLSFDSTQATGGVCLGLYTVAPGGSTWSFPDFASAAGIALNAGSGTGQFIPAVDHDLGYLRFSFPAVCAGQTVALFAK